jgi:hypothetical protein
MFILIIFSNLLPNWWESPLFFTVSEEINHGCKSEEYNQSRIQTCR